MAFTLKQTHNYSRKAQAPYRKISENSVTTEFKNYSVVGWVRAALDAEVGVITGVCC